MHKNLDTTFHIYSLYSVISEVGNVWKKLASSSKLPSDICSEIERPDLSAANSTLLVPMLSIRAALLFTSHTPYITFAMQCLVKGKVFVFLEHVF